MFTRFERNQNIAYHIHITFDTCNSRHHDDDTRGNGRWQILEELDDFQRKVEESEDSDPTSNEFFSQDLEQLLTRLDIFQQKLEQADEADVHSLQHLLVEFHH